MRDAIQRSKRAPRGIAPLIAFTAAGPAGPLLPRQAFARLAARGRGWRLEFATLTGAASRPTLITPHEAPSRWTGPGEYRTGRTARQVKFTDDDFIQYPVK